MAKYTEEPYLELDLMLPVFKVWSGWELLPLVELAAPTVLPEVPQKRGDSNRINRLEYLGMESHWYHKKN